MAKKAGTPVVRARTAGVSRGQRGGVEAVHQLGGVAAVADDPQPALLRGHQGEGLGAEGGHDLVGDLVDHVPHADGLGERGGQVHQVVERRRPGPGAARRRGRCWAGRAGGVAVGVRGRRGVMRTLMPEASG